jgi:hypothetical protein
MLHFEGAYGKCNKTIRVHDRRGSRSPRIRLLSLASVVQVPQGPHVLACITYGQRSSSLHFCSSDSLPRGTYLFVSLLERLYNSHTEGRTHELCTAGCQKFAAQSSHPSRSSLET